jgi:hypothetical protein
MIHRYAEAKLPLTYVIADGLADYDEATGRHNICNSRTTHCYSRSMYFALCKFDFIFSPFHICYNIFSLPLATITSIGYADISPYTNSEIIYQQSVCILGALIAAVVLGFFGAYQIDVDSNNDHTFQQKLQTIEHYCSYRNLSHQVRNGIVHQYEYIWKKMKTTQGERRSLLRSLPYPTILDIQMIIYQPLFQSCAVLNSCTQQFQRRLSGVLYPQVSELTTNHLSKIC